MGKRPKNAGDPSELDPPVVPIEGLENNSDRLDAVNGYGEFARRLSDECNIPQENHGDLRDALQCAYDAYVASRFASDRRASLRSSLNATRTLHRAMQSALRAFRSLDATTRASILRTLEDNALFDTIEPSMLRRHTLDELFADIADATEPFMDLPAAPRGRPSDTALKAFVTVLRQFWVEKLKRRFRDSFETDLQSHDLVPLNDASRFVVEAVEHLIGNYVEVATCRWMMKVVNRATLNHPVPAI